MQGGKDRTGNPYHKRAPERRAALARPPLLYCSDDCPGLRKALRAVWPRSLPQKCPAHQLRNVLSKLPRGVQAELKRQIHAVLYAKDYQTGLKKGRALIEQYQDRYPQAME